MALSLQRLLFLKYDKHIEMHLLTINKFEDKNHWIINFSMPLLNENDFVEESCFDDFEIYKQQIASRIREDGIFFDLETEGHLRGYLVVFSKNIGRLDAVTQACLRMLCDGLAFRLATIYGAHEIYEAHIRNAQTRLNELGHIAVYLGDKLATPLQEMQWISEELRDELLDDMHFICNGIDKNIDRINIELKLLVPYRKYASATIRPENLYKEDVK